MADKRISALPGASTPLAGTEVLPIVQGGDTVKVSVANLTAGRAVAMAGGSFTDNITQGTAAKGVNFTANTPAAGMTSQLLNWYEEGTWTPNQGAGLTVVGTFSSDGVYTRVGRLITISGHLRGSTSITCAAANLLLSNLPIATSNESTGIAVNGDIASSVGTVASGNVLFAAGSLTGSNSIFFSISYSI